MLNILCLLFVAIVLPKPSMASTIECIRLEPNKTAYLELSKAYAYVNCFAFENLTANSKIDILSFSPDNITNVIKTYDIKSGSKVYISESTSNNNGANLLSLNATNRDIAFVYKPLNNLDSNKNITISYVTANNANQIFLKVNNVVSGNTSPGNTGGTCKQGICDEEK